MKRQRTWPILLILGLLLGVSAVFSLNCGYSRIYLPDLLGEILHSDQGGASLVLLNIRLPRILLAVLCGMGLALSGCALQTVTDNPLADPGILGINAGAGFFVMLFLGLFPALHIDTKFYRPIFALAGGLLVAALLYGFSWRRGRIRPAHFLLGGIGASAGFSALMTILGADLESSVYQLVARWLAGNLWGTSWYQVRILFPYLLVLTPLLFFRAREMDVLLLGEEAAASLGVSVGRERRRLLFLASALAASCVSVSGGISFIGLVAPHIARRLTGGRHLGLLSASMLTGGILLVLADTAGRVLLPGLEIPAGVVISILAAPYFLYLLRRF